MFGIFRRNDLSPAVNQLLLILLGLIALVITVHIVFQLSLHQGAPSSDWSISLANRFNMDEEMSVPTWLASFLGIIVGFIGLVIAKAQKQTGAKISWWLFAAVGFFISIDELAALHELVLQEVHARAGLVGGQTLTQNAWLFILPFIVVIGIGIMTYWYRYLPRMTFFRLLIAVGVFAFGALVVEYVSTQVDRGVSQYTVGYVVLEEGLEYLGLWLLIRASLLHIAEFESGLHKRLDQLLNP